MRHILSALFAAALLPCAIAHADTVNYTLTGTFSGTLGSQAFNSVAGTIQMTGDSSQTVDYGYGYYGNTSGLSTITLDGLGNVTVLSPTFGASASTGGAGFYDMATIFGASIYDPSLVTPYALDAGFSDTGYLQIADAFLQPYASELTTGGLLTFTGDVNSDATFTAVSATTTTATTPEPSGFLLLVTGISGMAGMACRRRGALQ